MTPSVMSKAPNGAGNIPTPKMNTSNPVNVKESRLPESEVTSALEVAEVLSSTA